MQAIMKRLCAITLGVMWVAAANAAASTGVTLDKDLASIPWMAIVIAVILAGIGGLASTLQKLSASDNLSHWKLEVSKDLMASIVAGVVTFFLCESFDLNSSREAAAITIAGYGGSRLIDFMLEKFMKKIDDTTTL